MDIENNKEQQKRYDVGVFGLWSGCNYGSIVTYYALNQVISSMGKTVLMIDKPILTDRDVELKETHSRRFGREHYNISRQYRLEQMHQLNSFCDAFLIGSDQVWNYGISKNFGKAMYLDFAGEEKRKIAYGVSFGHGVDFAPEEERRVIAEYMSVFDGIGTRESDGVRLCRECYGIRAQQVLDPVFLADPRIYDTLIEKSQYREEEPFFAAYILDPTPEKTEAILHLQKELGGIKVINLLDGLPWLFQKNKKATNLPNCIENVQVEDWLYYLKNARFILTDSCHGASFALIFRKDFIAITNRHRGYSRFRSLSKLFHFEDHLVMNPKEILENPNLMSSINYGVIDDIMDLERRRCYKWLCDVLDSPKKNEEELKRQNLIENLRNITPDADGKSELGIGDEKTVLKTVKAENCTGCGACVSACPRNAIKLTADSLGYYRAQIDYNKCINCGLCTEVCPAHRLPENRNEKNPECFAFAAADDKVLYASSSGGAFPVLAEAAFARGGIVVGAAWKDDFSVEHIMVSDQGELHKLQKSKYLQSYLGDIFRRIKAKLEEGIFVLFSGCPCQVAGLKAFLKKDYDNLILVDLLCGNSPSTMFFKKYIEDAFPEGLKKYEFRHKVQGWMSDCVTVTVTVTDGTSIVRRGGAEDDYQRLYHNHTMCAHHCENCRYQSVPRYGDLTIGDFWGIGKRDAAIDAKKGVSVVLCNNEKGRRYFEGIKEKSVGLKKKVPLSWLGGNGYAINGRHNYCGPKRDVFYDAIGKMSFGRAADYALKPNHGMYGAEGVYAPLCYHSKALRFAFDHAIWEEHHIMGITCLFVKGGRAPVGRYATLPMNEALAKGKAYMLRVRFKLRTESRRLNFHVKDSGSNYYQVIHTYEVPKDPGDWVKIEVSFVPKSSIYDEFMFGASQLTGEGNFLAIDYIDIVPSETGNGMQNKAIRA